MVLVVVAGLKNGELVMAGVVGGDCRDKICLVFYPMWIILTFCVSKAPVCIMSRCNMFVLEMFR